MKRGKRAGRKRKPGSGELCEIVLDPATNLTAQVGIGRCHHDFLRAALNSLLQAEIAGAHTQKAARIQRMQNAISKLTRKLP